MNPKRVTYIDRVFVRSESLTIKTEELSGSSFSSSITNVRHARSSDKVLVLVSRAAFRARLFGLLSYQSSLALLDLLMISPKFHT